jgi:hypothetical protein
MITWQAFLSKKNEAADQHDLTPQMQSFQQKPMGSRLQDLDPNQWMHSVDAGAHMPPPTALPKTPQTTPQAAPQPSKPAGTTINGVFHKGLQGGTPISPEDEAKWRIPNAKPGEPNIQLPPKHPDVVRDQEAIQRFASQYKAQQQQQPKRPWWKPSFLG